MLKADAFKIFGKENRLQITCLFITYVVILVTNLEQRQEIEGKSKMACTILKYSNGSLKL